MQDEDKIIEKLKELDQSKDQKVTLASLKTLKSAIYNRDVDLETKVKLRTLNEPTFKSEDIKIYFCAVCGKKVIGSNIGLDSFPNRKSDNSIAINMKQIFLKLYLKQEGMKIIKRQHCISRQYIFQIEMEKQFRWCCEECGVHIAYQCIPYEEGQQIMQGIAIKESNKPYLYVLNDAVVINQQFSKLHSEVEKLKEQMEYDQK